MRWLLLVAAGLGGCVSGGGQGSSPAPATYRLPFADGTRVKVFDDFDSHRPRGRIDFFAVEGKGPYRVVAAAPGTVTAIQDSFHEQQSGRAAADCHNNYVWVHGDDGLWANYSHIAAGTVTGAAGLHVGSRVAAGTYLGDEGAVGCAMLEHVHFEAATPAVTTPIDAGGFLTDNQDGKREVQVRFCGVPGGVARKGEVYTATAC